MQREVYFYQQNTQVLKFNVKKEQQKILFNHYISQKENLQRMKKELPRGCFYMALNTASEDTGLSVQQVRTLIKQFTELGIINKIEEFPKHLKKPTIWEYVSCREANYQDIILDNTRGNIQEASDSKDSTVSTNNQNDNQFNRQDNTSKKELSTKKVLNIKTYNEAVRLYNLYPRREGKEVALNIIPTLIMEYGADQIERCIMRYSNCVKGRDMKYIKNASTFFKKGYIDYLDENYEDIYAIANRFTYDEETGEVIKE